MVEKSCILYGVQEAETGGEEGKNTPLEIMSPVIRPFLPGSTSNVRLLQGILELNHSTLPA